MLYLLVAIAVLISFVFLIRGLSSPHPEVVKKYYKTTMIILGILLIPILLKVGQPLIAALIGAMLAIGPSAHKILQLAYTFKLFRKVFDKEPAPLPAADAGMTIAKAREILSVSSTATRTEIEESYKNLMKRNHPDTGGSQFFARQLNQARDLLLR
jgi:hypothetical protein